MPEFNLISIFTYKFNINTLEAPPYILSLPHILAISLQLRFYEVVRY